MRHYQKIFALLTFSIVLSVAAHAQTTAFTYQGKLTDGSVPANGVYTMRFDLFAGSSGGTALATQSVPAVSVANGIFTVNLDSDVGAVDLFNATAIGAWAFVSQSNSLILGSINGVNGATTDSNVGIGTSAPAARLHVDGSVRVTNGFIFVTNPNTVIITSPNGACWGITVSNTGGLATFPVSPCP